MIPYTQWQKQGLRYKCEQWRKNNEEKTIQALGKYMLYQPILGTYKEEPLTPHDQAPYLEDDPKWAQIHDTFYHVIDDLQLRPEQEQHMSYWRQDETTKSK